MRWTGMHYDDVKKHIIYCRVYNHITKATEITAGSNYHLFKEGIKPEWEDPVNDLGGKWVVTSPKNKHSELNDLWLTTVRLCYASI